MVGMLDEVHQNRHGEPLDRLPVPLVLLGARGWKDSVEFEVEPAGQIVGAVPAWAAGVAIAARCHYERVALPAIIRRVGWALERQKGRSAQWFRWSVVVRGER
jgi:hypothetical protein